MSGKKNIQLTGFRLIAVLISLFEKDLSKNEIIELLNKKYGFKNLSKETIKLDINTLIKAGFNITRGKRTNNYKYSLDKSFIKLKPDKNELLLLNSIKNTAFEFCGYDEILNLKSFFEKIPFENAETSDLYNFKIFNSVNKEIVKELESAVKNNKTVSIIYNSPDKGETEMEFTPDKITFRNDKLYLEGISNIHDNYASLRADNIRKIIEIKDKTKEIKTSDKKKTRYVITKSFYENNPPEEFEKAVKIDENEVEIEACNIDDFFVVQRILTLGKNCLKIKRKEIKQNVLKILNETLKEYQY